MRVGTVEALVAKNPGIPFLDGYPVYVDTAQAFVVIVEPGPASGPART